MNHEGLMLPGRTFETLKVANLTAGWKKRLKAENLYFLKLVFNLFCPATLSFNLFRFLFHVLIKLSVIF